MRILRDLFILALIFGLIWVFFTYVPIIPDKEYFGVPVEKEEALSKWIFENQIKSDPTFDIVEDDALTDSIIHLLSNRLLEEIDEPLFNYQFYVVKSDDINAFTIPGGRIFVFTGLLDKTEHPEELVSVLAHEIGHAEKRHVLNKLVKEVGLTVLLSGDELILGEVARTLGSTKFDRVQEEHADKYAFDLLERSSVHPKYFASMMLKFKSVERLDSDQFEFVNTHPGTDSRVEAALKYQVDEEFVETPFEVDWEAFKKHLGDLDRAD